MEEEISNIQENDTCVLEEPPKGVKAIGKRWVFANKTDASGELTRRPAGLVAQGFPQRLGMDYNETFASVASYTTLRPFIAVVASQNLELYRSMSRLHFGTASLTKLSI